MAADKTGRTIVRDSVGVKRGRHGRKVQFEVVQERVLGRQQRRAVNHAVASGGGGVEGNDDVRMGADWDEASSARMLEKPVARDNLTVREERPTVFQVTRNIITSCDFIRAVSSHTPFTRNMRH